MFVVPHLLSYYYVLASECTVGKFSREIQKAEDTDALINDVLNGKGPTRWHIPIFDKKAWLCIQIGPAV